MSIPEQIVVIDGVRVRLDEAVARGYTLPGEPTVPAAEVPDQAPEVEPEPEPEAVEVEPEPEVDKAPAKARTTPNKARAARTK